MSREERRFERIGSKTVFSGRILEVSVDEFRYPDGEVAEREIVHHPGAVAIVAHDEKVVYLVRQPREAVGEPDMLELPAGRLDKEGEPPEETALRELQEEIGKDAQHLEHLLSFHSSVGSMDEIVHIYLATRLFDATADSGENERIEIVRWPLSDLDAAINATTDAKTIIGLMLLRDQLELS